MLQEFGKMSKVRRRSRELILRRRNKKLKDNLRLLRSCPRDSRGVYRASNRKMSTTLTDTIPLSLKIKK